MRYLLMLRTVLAGAASVRLTKQKSIEEYLKQGRTEVHQPETHRFF
jgi:hypothetical protein